MLLVAVTGGLVLSGIAPVDRLTWLLEVVPVLLGIPLAVTTAGAFPLTPLLYRLLAIHACILIVGGHYTYAEVPIGRWVQDAFGLARNHYDRLLQLARLGEGDWWRFAHRAPPHLRAQLVERRDLPASVRDFLTMRLSGAERLFGGNGTAAVVGPAGTPPPPVPELDVAAATPALDSGRSQVRELIDRIAAFRARDRAAADATPTVERAPVPPTETRWTWRCDEQGMFVPSPDAPAALPGHWLTEFDTPEAPLQLVRAFERRAPFRDSIVAIEIDTLGGRWRLAGLPQFDRRSGRFTGYWGSAIAIDRAPPADSRAEGLFGTGAASVGAGASLKCRRSRSADS